MADGIDQQQRIAIQLLQCLRQGVVGAGLLQLLHQRGGLIEAAGLIQPDLRQGDADRQMGLAHAAGTEQQHVLAPLQPLALAAQGLEILPWAGLNPAAVVVVRQRLAPGQMDRSQQPLLASTRRSVDQQATRRRARTDSGDTLDPGRLSGSQGMTPSMKATALS